LDRQRKGPETPEEVDPRYYREQAENGGEGDEKRVAATHANGTSDTATGRK
ncbi:hypothetical protein HMPREF0277_1660, partial [Corynebacterium accolens ATCC 49726]